MTNRQSLDETDRRLIEMLRDNSRLPTATLARRLGVSRGTVQNRIDRLTANGVIQGFTIRLQGDVDTGLIAAITSLEIRSSDHKPVIAQLKRIPEVARIHATNGRWDLVAEIRTRDLASLDRVLNAVRTIKAVSASETSILLAEAG
ncbi:MAG TPA: Lrp/AsnC family transcriptional regulator [Magnetospirillaceae bacterium]|nr:Lrp/AsnC family transcriptional regulator [Magnetospirillaceae bacterium]